MSDIIVKAENISKSFHVRKNEKTFLRTVKSFFRLKHESDELWVLKDMSFEVKKGDKIAIVGRNGCGKTTLLRILAGTYNLTSGHLLVNENPVSLFKSTVGTCNELAVVDNVYLFGAIYGLDRSFLKVKMDEILGVAELTRLAFCPLKELSSGQVVRFAFSVFSIVEGNFLMFDESLMSVDMGFVEKCKTYFKNLISSDKTVIMTSHNTHFLNEYCKIALWIDDGHIRMSGEAREVIGAYERSFRTS
jgi:ABC-type polysaccharide/polyol phosphate transport system ATPase subunit